MPPIVAAALSFWIILFLLKIAFPYLAPFLLGLALALVLDAPISYLESRGWSRPFTSFVLVGVTFLTLPVLAALFLVKLWQEVQALLEPGLLGQLAAELPEPLLRLFSELGFASGLEIPRLLWRWGLAIPDFVLVWTLTAFSAYFFCRDKRRFSQLAAELIPKSREVSMRQLYLDTSGALWHLLRVQLVLMLLTFSVSFVFFSLLQLPYPILSSFLAGFFDLCPLLGPGLVYLALALFQLWLGNSTTALALGLGYLLLLLLRQWGEPHLVGDRLGLHPLTAVMGLYIGFKFWGPVGAVLAPILLVVIKAFQRQSPA